MDLGFLQLEEHIMHQDPQARIISIQPDALIFEERVKMNCFYCARYNVSWKCPPKIPALDYPRMFQEFDYAAFIYVDMPFTSDNYSDVRSNSSVRLHKILLDSESFLLKNGNIMALSFIGGSCKLCKNGCGKDRCNNPYQARTPLEATGVNVVASAEKYGLHIKFPVETHIIRLGLLLW